MGGVEFMSWRRDSTTRTERQEKIVATTKYPIVQIICGVCPQYITTIASNTSYALLYQASYILFVVFLS